MSIHIFCLSFVQCCVSYVLFGTEYLAIATFQTSGYNKFIFYKHARKQSVPYKHDIPSTQRLILTHCRHSFSLIATHVVCDFARLLLWTCHRKSDLVSLISSQERVRRRSWFSPVVPRSALMSKRGKLLPTVFRGFFLTSIAACRIRVISQNVVWQFNSSRLTPTVCFTLS